MNIIKWVRRTHLYAGLFLAPWVLMYGVSGFIFSHYSWFADQDTSQTFWTLDPTAAAHRLDANTLARNVVAALNETADDGGTASAWNLSGESTPRFAGEISLQGGDVRAGSIFLLFDPAADHGRTYRAPPAIVARAITLDSNEAALLRTAQDEIVAAATAAEPNLRDVHFDDASFPALAFQLERDGNRQIASYDLRTGVLTLTPPSAAGSMKPRDFLTSLHTSHGYPDDEHAPKVITVRAMFVDAMACTMCFWALSGLAMWWQLKSLRRPGWAVIAATLIVVGLVWSGMYRVFTSGG